MVNRIRFVVTGRVQRGGFRVQVAQIASQLGVKGVVRNLKDGSVEIFCEGDDKTLEEFKKMIDIKSPPEDLFGVNVESIDEYGEGTKNYVNPPEKFEYFHIDYLNEDLLKTSVERAEIGILAFKAMHKDLKEGQTGITDGQKAMHKDLKEGQTGMTDGQKAMHQDMNKSFSQLNVIIGTKFESMDVKYGDISKTMREMHNDLKEMKDLFAKLVNHIVKE